MEDVQQDLCSNPIAPPAEECAKASHVAKLIRTAATLEACADLFVVGVRVDLIARDARAEEASAIDVDMLAESESSVQRVAARACEH